MRTLNLKLAPPNVRGDFAVLLDGKEAKFKKTKTSCLECDYVTENSSVDIEIHRIPDVGGFWWFITQLFFFLISIFGIFDTHAKESCMQIQYKGRIDLRETNSVRISFKVPKENTPAVQLQSDLFLSESENLYVLDKALKKKIKWLKVSKILLFFACVGIAIGIVLKLFL